MCVFFFRLEKAELLSKNADLINHLQEANSEIEAAQNQRKKESEDFQNKFMELQDSLANAEEGRRVLKEKVRCNNMRDVIEFI